MNVKQIFELTSELIKFKAISGQEKPALDFYQDFLKSLGWELEIIPHTDGRYCIYVKFGRADILFSSHIDVVPAKPEQFEPKVVDNALYGRGALDAQGQLVTLLATCKKLLDQGHNNFAYLVVFEEEVGGTGAKVAAGHLKNEGIKYLINAEPTQNKLAIGHKGLFQCNIICKGKNAHSGYPELGEDANKKLIEIASRLYQLDLGKDSELGTGTINIGQINAGSGANIISDYAKMDIVIRNVLDADVMEKMVGYAVEDLGDIEIINNKNPVKLKTLEGFETYIANYFTDVANLLELGAENLMYGAGDIARAHTDNEYITAAEIEQAIADYLKMYAILNEQ